MGTVDVVRKNPNFVVNKSWRRFSICDTHEYTPEMQALLQMPDQGLGGMILKNHDTTRVGIAHINNKDVVIKRYNIKGFWHGVKRALQPTRAVHCWDQAQALLSQKLCTPKPIAIVENRFGFVRREGFFIYEYIVGHSALEVFAKQPFNYDALLPKATCLIQLIHNLFKHRFYQKDMNPNNFIFVHDTPYLIDLDSIRKSSCDFSKRKIFKELRRFMRYWQDKPNIKQIFAAVIQKEFGIDISQTGK